MCMKLQKYHCHVIRFNIFLNRADGIGQSGSPNFGQGMKVDHFKFEGTK